MSMYSHPNAHSDGHPDSEQVSVVDGQSHEVYNPADTDSYSRCFHPSLLSVWYSGCMSICYYWHLDSYMGCILIIIVTTVRKC